MEPERCRIVHIHACIRVSCKCTWYLYFHFEGCRMALHVLIFSCYDINYLSIMNLKCDYSFFEFIVIY